MKVSDIRKKINELLEARGFTEEKRAKIIEPIMWAVTHGNNQGLLKLVGEPALQEDLSKGEPFVVQETVATAEIDGNENNAMIALDVAMQKAVSIAQESGVAVVGLHGTHSSSGALAYYAELASKQGFVTIIAARTPAMVTPPDSLEPFYGTNPIAFSFPTLDEPLTFDMATAGIAWYGILEAIAKGESVPEGLIVDAFGQPTTDPIVATKDGFVLPFGGRKGSNLALMVELLGGLLVGGAFGPNKGDWGHLIIVIDPSKLNKNGDFKALCSSAIAQMKSAKTVSGMLLRLPGDRAKEFYENCQKNGEVDVHQSALNKLGWQDNSR